MILPVILCGGSGTRLWPLSRERYPKQFLQLGSSHSLLQETLLRLETDSHQPALLICNEEHRFICAEQVRAIGYQPGGIILEPQGRNTAPAIALAALKARSREKIPSCWFWRQITLLGMSRPSGKALIKVWHWHTVANW